MSNKVRINENLVVNKDFFEFLSNSGGIIPAIIMNLPTKEDINFIAPSDKSDMISYLPSTKVGLVSDPFNNPHRQLLKVGRLINKLILEKYLNAHGVTDKTVEMFTNTYKSWFDRSNSDIRIVSGEEIRKWYLEKNYFSPDGRIFGSLWNSCMRYHDRQSFLDLYCVNPEVKMLVMIAKVDGREYVRCRAILWDNVTVIKSNDELPNNIKVMDRIYSVFESDVIIFKRWAEENGYVPKWEQNSKSHQIFDVKGNATVAKTKIQLDKYLLSSYPYLDTFPYFKISKGELSNYEFGDWDYKLIQANGSLERQRSEDEDDYIEDNWDDD